MKKIIFIAILLLMGTPLLYAGELASKMVPFVVDVSSDTATEIRAANGNRRDVVLLPPAYDIDIGYDSAISTTTSSIVFGSGDDNLVFRDYIGSLYGICPSTTVATLELRGYELEYGP